jgi:hypothetical protein
MKIKSLILSALSALFVCAGSYAQSDYYVVHGTDENVSPIAFISLNCTSNVSFCCLLHDIQSTIFIPQ